MERKKERVHKFKESWLKEDIVYDVELEIYWLEYQNKVLGCFVVCAESMTCQTREVTLGVGNRASGRDTI